MAAGNWLRVASGIGQIEAITVKIVETGNESWRFKRAGPGRLNS